MKYSKVYLLSLFFLFNIILSGFVFAQNERTVSMDFDNVDINIFIKFISQLTGNNFIVDDKVRGKITVISPTPISVKNAYHVFESVLEVNNLATVPSGDVIKIIPSVTARQSNVETRFNENFISNPNDRFITQIINLDYVQASEVRKILIPLVSKSGILIAYTDSNLLILTDYESNIQRLMRIIKKIDVYNDDSELTFYALKYASAEKVAAKVTKLLRPKKVKKGEVTLTALADERTNSLVVVSSAEDKLRVQDLVDRLDQPTPKGKSNIQVVHLENAKAEELSKVLTGLAGKGATDKNKQPVISKDVQVVADKSTNSLVITAKPEEFNALEAIITHLDSPRKQVYVEAAIIEVTTEDGFDFGLDWQFGGKYGPSDEEGLVFGNINTAIGNTVSSVESRISSNSANGKSFSLGFLSFPFMYNGEKYFSLGSFLTASKDDSTVNIVSTPQIMTLENEEAKVTVAENRPYITSQDTSSSNSVSYNNYEYKDVGVILEIEPQINNKGFVRLKIYQEVSRIDESITGNIDSTTPITRKRTTETIVEVKDGQTIAISGLIEEQQVENETGLPYLKDVPGLGWLFKTKTSSLIKKNLIVFITPHVILSAEDARDLYFDKKRHLNQVTFGSDGRADCIQKPLFLFDSLALEKK